MIICDYACHTHKSHTFECHHIYNTHIFNTHILLEIQKYNNDYTNTQRLFHCIYIYMRSLNKYLSVYNIHTAIHTVYSVYIREYITTTEQSVVSHHPQSRQYGGMKHQSCIYIYVYNNSYICIKYKCICLK